MSVWTPSTEQVRSHYVFNQSDRWDPLRGEAFDRWLARVRTDAVADALDQAAAEWHQPYDPSTYDAAEWLAARSAAIRADDAGREEAP